MLILLCADESSIGRFDASLASDHQRMQLFFIPDDPDEIEAELDGDIDDSCTWEGVICDRDKRITSIYWMPTREALITLEGSIDFPMMPRFVTTFYVVNQGLRGKVALDALPQVMENLMCIKCQFSGTLNLSALPNKMQQIVFKANWIEAIEGVCSLPETLTKVEIAEQNLCEKALAIGVLGENIKIDLAGCRLDDVQFARDSDRSKVWL